MNQVKNYRVTFVALNCFFSICCALMLTFISSYANASSANTISFVFDNAFLQGQFRNSNLTYEYNGLNYLLFEAWAGYTHSFENGYQIRYIVRAHTSEIKYGVGDRNLIRGGLPLSRI
jgi:hypothetical protein